MCTHRINPATHKPINPITQQPSNPASLFLIKFVSTGWLLGRQLAVCKLLMVKSICQCAAMLCRLVTTRPTQQTIQPNQPFNHLTKQAKPTEPANQPNQPNQLCWAKIETALATMPVSTQEALDWLAHAIKMSKHEYYDRASDEELQQIRNELAMDVELAYRKVKQMWQTVNVSKHAKIEHCYAQTAPIRLCLTDLTAHKKVLNRNWLRIMANRLDAARNAALVTMFD